MKIARGAVSLTLGKAAYGAEALAEGALALGERAQVFVEETKAAHLVEIRPAGKASPAALLALAGSFSTRRSATPRASASCARTRR
ncbi:MAG: hypothetical protein M0D55_08545 [Elusimicrobiota bacterium]|nr:MAG: hypothetical protein M0D55_08545 [Elusimicrobiota bacterium]